MRQVIRYEVEVFFLKSNLDLAVLVLDQGDVGSCLVGVWGPPASGGSGASCPQGTRHPPLLVLLAPLLFLLDQHPLGSLMLSHLSPLWVSKLLGEALPPFGSVLDLQPLKWRLHVADIRCRGCCVHDGQLRPACRRPPPWPGDPLAGFGPAVSLSQPRIFSQLHPHHCPA